MSPKDEWFSFLNALASSLQLQAIWVKVQDQGVDPAPDCGAQHIPRQFDMNVVATPPFFENPSILPTSGFPIFDENLNFTGSFSDPILHGIFFEPPTKN